VTGTRSSEGLAPTTELGRLTRLGFSTLAECLLSVPKAFVDYTSPVRRVHSSMLGKDQYLIVSFEDVILYDGSNRRTLMWNQARRAEVRAKDEAGKTVVVTFFGNCWPCKDLQDGDTLHVHGELVYEFNEYRLKRPSFVDPRSRGRIAVLYKGKQGQVSGETLAEGISRAMHRIDDAEVYLLAQAGLREHEFAERAGMSAKELLMLLHRPSSVAQGEMASALARELTAEAVVRRANAARIRPPVAKSAIPIDKQFLSEIIADLPYPLTEDQRRAIDEIVSDLRSPYPMRRLLSGDVGTGKSVTFMAPAAAAYEAGASVAILVPSLPLVSQLASELRQLFPGLPVCEVVGGSNKIEEGVCVGTTALLSAAKKAKKKFDVVIVDEEHKFSVEQKTALHGAHTNALNATATAIPRTQAMVNFGGMDVSILRECPVKKKISTRITGDDDVERLDAFIDKVISHKGQVAVLYPLVNDGKGAGDMVSVIEAGEAWLERFPGRVGVLHGKMEDSAKVEVIKAMNRGEFDILVSSLVIEVGVTLPSLKVMLVNSPERFGVSQLHQLRGRVARKGGQGYMFLHATGELSDDSRDRMNLLCECSDGFMLAEHDMGLRGFGDVQDDSESQTGTSRVLFWGVDLTHQELRGTAIAMGMASAVQ
jgi:ATP-dependent DNA helicase RecG